MNIKVVTAAETAAVKAAPDPFDPAALRLDQSFAGAGVKRLLTTVPVRKPNRQDFVRVHPDEDYRLTCAIVELKEEREVYVIAPHIVPAITGEYVAATLFTTINRQGVLSLWPVRLPGPDGKTNAWHESAATAAALAMTTWTRITANMALGAYEILKAEGNLIDPVWPEHSFNEILAIAFNKGRLVNSIEHPLLQRLRGLV
jgi:hypothetical protein